MPAASLPVPTQGDIWRGRLQRARLFGVSYAPLLLIVSLRSIHHWVWCGIFMALFVIEVADGFWLVKGSTRIAARPLTLTAVKTQGGAVAGYLATYLLPFLTAGPEHIGDYLAFGVYFVVALVIFVQSDLALINPTLYLLGWHIVEVTDRNRRVLLVLQGPATEGATVRVVDFLDVYVVKSD